MSVMRKYHTKRKRRQYKMHIASHGKFEVGHKAKSGRTGSIKSKRRGTNE